MKRILKIIKQLDEIIKNDPYCVSQLDKMYDFSDPMYDNLDQIIRENICNKQVENITEINNEIQKIKKNNIFS